MVYSIVGEAHMMSSSRHIRYWIALLLAGLFLARWVWADTMELITYYPTTGGGASNSTDALAIGSAYSGLTPPDGTLLVADRVGIGTTNPQGPLHVVGADDATSLAIFKKGLDTGAAGTPEIRLGLGTDDPQEQLHLTGNLRLPTTTATSGIIYLGADPFIHAYGTDNTFLGKDAGNFTLTEADAIQNTTLGHSTLHGLTTGHDNTAIGYQALTATTEGKHNTAMGSEAMLSNTTGSYNTAVGNEALRDNTTGEHNTALGHGALIRNTTGQENTALGYAALRSNTTGNQNTAAGTLTLSNNTASGNTAMGYVAMSSNSTGTENVAFGSQCLYRNTTGNNNTALGAYALEHNSTGSDNVAFGTQSLYMNNASNNTAIGRGAMVVNTSGANNVAVGYGAGRQATGSGNIFLGRQAGMNETGSNKLYIENSDSDTPLIYGEFDNDLVTINGNLGINTTTFGTNAVGVLAIANGTIPSTSPADQIQLFADDVDQGGGTMSSELHVLDEAGNTTTLSPHNFTLIPEGPSEPLAWSFYSERGTQAINVDMLKVIRLIETLSGEPLVHIKDLKTGKPISPNPQQRQQSALAPLQQEVKALQVEAQALQQKWQDREDQLHQLQEKLSSFQGRSSE